MTPDETIDTLPEHWPTLRLRAQAAEAARVAQFHADAHARLAEARQAAQAAETSLDVDAIVTASRHVADFERVVSNLPAIPSIGDPEALEVAGAELSAAVSAVSAIQPVLSVEPELAAWSSIQVSLRSRPGYQQPVTLPGERPLESRLREFRAERESLVHVVTVWPQQWPDPLEALRVATGCIDQAKRAVVTGEALARAVSEANQLRTVQGYDWSPVQPDFPNSNAINTPEIRILRRFREQRQGVPA